MSFMPMAHTRSNLKDENNATKTKPGEMPGFFYWEDVMGKNNDITNNEQNNCKEMNGDLQYFIDNFAKRFPDFEKPQKDKWINSSVRIIFENRIFYIGIESNEWHTMIKLIQKENSHDDQLEELQKCHYKEYLDGILEILSERMPSIWSCYSGRRQQKTLKSAMESTRKKALMAANRRMFSVCCLQY